MSIYIIYLTYTNDKELQLIPYIGPTNAQTIIALRETKGSLDQDTLETLLRTKLDSAVFRVLDFISYTCLPVSHEYRAEGERLGSMHTSGQFQHSGQMESSQSCLKGPDQTAAAQSRSGVRDKEGNKNVY